MAVDRLSVWFLLKAREFHKQGYKEVSAKDLRNFCEKFLWKRQKPQTYRLLKESLLSVTPNQYFDYQSMLIQTEKKTDFRSIDLSQLD